VDKNMNQITPGYARFMKAWIRAGLSLDNFVSEEEWEREVGEYKYCGDNIHDMDLLNIFPEGTPLLKRNIKDVNKIVKEIEPLLRELLQGWIGIICSSITDPEKRKKEIQWAGNTFYNKPLQKFESMIKKWERMLMVTELREVGKEVVGLNIARAKEYPISRLIEINRAGFAKCPFHNEKTASLKVWEKENRWYCFGCNERGDVIDLYMKMNNVDIKTAVKSLNG
jgi:hypothetical protein